METRSEAEDRIDEMSIKRKGLKMRRKKKRNGNKKKKRGQEG